MGTTTTATAAEQFLQKELRAALAELRQLRADYVRLSMEVAAIARGREGIAAAEDVAARDVATAPFVPPSYPTLYPEIEFDEFMEDASRWPQTGETTTLTPPAVGQQQAPVHAMMPNGRVARLDGAELFASGQSAAPPNGGVE
jgi:hypothetical protein